MTTSNKILTLIGLMVIAGAAGAAYALFRPVQTTQDATPRTATATSTVTTPEQPKQSASLWMGTYVRKGSTDGASATLEIFNERGTSFEYKLTSFNGSHIGNIEAMATSTGANAASLVPNSECTVTLHKTDTSITVQAIDCSGFHGARAGFDGEYELGGTVRKLTLKELGGDSPIFRTQAEVTAFTQMIKPAYADLYVSSFIDIQEGRDEDSFGARVYRGGVPGLYTSMEAIIMIGDESGAMWAAVIQDNVVLYTTNVPEYVHKLPKTIETWRERFKDKQVVYLSAI